MMSKGFFEYYIGQIVPKDLINRILMSGLNCRRFEITVLFYIKVDKQI